MQGAGGVGELLSVADSVTGDLWYSSFDTNGNVSEYLDDMGAVVAPHEYSPFGRVIASSGSPDNFAFRFSTKYQDDETDLLYYGFRYYDPETGRWASRDPIEERGGLNLYGFVGNDGVNQWDYLGQNGINPGFPVPGLIPPEGMPGVHPHIPGNNFPAPEWFIDLVLDEAMESYDENHNYGTDEVPHSKRGDSDCRKGYKMGFG